MLNIKVIWRSMSHCCMVVDRSWPKQQCAWVWSKLVD